MTKNLLTEVVKKIGKICGEENVKVVFMGGIAVGVYGLPRATFDVDCLGLISDDSLSRLLGELKKNGFTFDIQQPVKTINGKPFITLMYSKYKIYVDIFIAQSDFYKKIITRARSIKFAAAKIRIIAPEDLILMKLQARREKDLDDVRGILQENRGKLDFAYLQSWAKKLEVDLFLRDELASLRNSEG